MEFLRHSKDAWGQKMLVGVSWDLLWIPIVAAFAVIVVHFALRYWRNKARNKNIESVSS